MKKIFSVMFSFLVIFASCKNESEFRDNTGEKEVEIVVNAPSMGTRASIESENRIERLDVLVFQGEGDNAEFLYRRYAWPKNDGSNQFRTTLKLGKDLTIFFAANSEDLLDKLQSGVLKEGSGTKWASVMKAMVMTSPKELKHSNGLPMWGHVEKQTIEDRPVNNIGKVSLLRSVASADFMLHENAKTNFELEAVYLVYAADKGYLPYHESQLSNSAEEPAAILPYSPDDMKTNVDWEVLLNGETSVANIFYMYDNDASLPSGNDGKKQSKLVMKGKWLDPKGVGRSTYYPVAFRETDEDSGEQTRLQVIRNFKYLVTVTKVNGDGFDSLEDAKDGEEINVDYDVIPWEQNDDKELIVEGNYYVSIARKYANVWKGERTTDTVGMSTNYKREDIRLSREKNVAGEKGVYEINLADEATKVDFCTVQLLESNNRFTFRFRTLSKLPDELEYRQSTLYVRVGKISFPIMVRQHNMSLNDWENGGEIVWP